MDITLATQSLTEGQTSSAKPDDEEEEEDDDADVVDDRFLRLTGIGINLGFTGEKWTNPVWIGKLKEGSESFGIEGIESSNVCSK